MPEDCENDHQQCEEVWTLLPPPPAPFTGERAGRNSARWLVSVPV